MQTENANYKGDRKLIAFQLEEMNQALARVEDGLTQMRIEHVNNMTNLKVELLGKINEVEIAAARRAGITGALSGLISSAAVAVASLVAIFKKSS